MRDLIAEMDEGFDVGTWNDFSFDGCFEWGLFRFIRAEKLRMFLFFRS